MATSIFNFLIMIYLISDVMKRMKLIKKAYKETKRSSLIVYAILRFLVIICLILEIIRGDFNNALLCLLSLILFIVPLFLQRALKFTLPSLLESIIFMFIFASEILGEINNFYGLLPFWDSMLHVINGFLAAAIGFSLVDLLNRNSKGIKLSPLYVSIVGFCFSMTIGIMWEFFEFSTDKFLKSDMQKDTIVNSIKSVMFDLENDNNTIIYDDIKYTILYNQDNEEILKINGYLDIGLNDTMKDLFVNLIGAFVFSILGYFYLIQNKKNSFITNFIPTSGSKEIPESVKNLTFFKKRDQI